MDKQQELLSNIQELRQLYKELIFKDSDLFQASQNQGFCVYQTIGIKITRKLSSFNSNSVLERVWYLFNKLRKEKDLPKDVQSMLIEISGNKEELERQFSVTVGPNFAKEPIFKSLGWSYD